MSGAKHTMTPEEEAAWMTNPASAMNRAMNRGSRVDRPAPQPLPHIGKQTPSPVYAPTHCNLTGCTDEATETGRCVRHEAIWARLHEGIS